MRLAGLGGTGLLGLGGITTGAAGAAGAAGAISQVDVSKADSSFSLELVVRVLAFGACRGQQPPLHGLAQERN